jgi:hypothetical protein
MADEVFDPIRKLIESEFKAYWDANGGGVPIEWDGVPFEQPSAKKWVRVVILPGQGVQASIGSRKLEKQPGVAVVSVFIEKNTGAKPAYDLADKAGEALRYKQLTDGTVTVSMEAPFVTRGNPADAFFTINLNVPYEAQHLTL